MCGKEILHVTIQPIEIVLPGHLALVVGLHQQPLWAHLRNLVGEGQPSRRPSKDDFSQR